MLATLGNLFSSIVVSILVKSTGRRFRGAVAIIGHKGALGDATLILKAVCTGPNNLSHLFGHPWLPETFL